MNTVVPKFHNRPKLFRLRNTIVPKSTTRPQFLFKELVWQWKSTRHGFGFMRNFPLGVSHLPLCPPPIAMLKRELYKPVLGISGWTWYKSGFAYNIYHYVLVRNSPIIHVPGCLPVHNVHNLITKLPDVLALYVCDTMGQHININLL